ncbi:hypothetical protein IEQ34_018273 [Dendrobium chrysotoxum]|uniref:Uncharacterized protein n=1 Tax=Dendrobium chrysotoxum TaxID=161865 RepID=A0AAV7GE48_DENCH|nr:hypothetical protein IEQ34_018273 [Dendrobium chrysotoxum]
MHPSFGVFLDQGECLASLGTTQFELLLPYRLIATHSILVACKSLSTKQVVQVHSFSLTHLRWIWHSTNTLRFHLGQFSYCFLNKKTSLSELYSVGFSQNFLQPLHLQNTFKSRLDFFIFNFGLERWDVVLVSAAALVLDEQRRHKILPQQLCSRNFWKIIQRSGIEVALQRSALLHAALWCWVFLTDIWMASDDRT